MRKEFKMSKVQLEKLLDACKPVPYMIMSGIVPCSPQENANRALHYLGSEMGFDSLTVRPVPGEDMDVFTAEEVTGCVHNEG